jgi:hypothetical protein
VVANICLHSINVLSSIVYGEYAQYDEFFPVVTAFANTFSG